MFGTTELILIVFAFLFIAVPIYLIVKYTSSSRKADSENTKKCKYCAEHIKAEAIVCRYCNRSLTS